MEHRGTPNRLLFERVFLGVHPPYLVAKACLLPRGLDHRFGSNPWRDKRREEQILPSDRGPTSLQLLVVFGFENRGIQEWSWFGLDWQKLAHSRRVPAPALWLLHFHRPLGEDLPFFCRDA